MTLDQTHVRWIVGYFANVSILTALIYRRAWRTLPVLFAIESYSFVAVLVQDILHSPAHRALWHQIDEAWITYYVAISVCLCLHRISGVAKWLPPCYFSLGTLATIERFYFGFYASYPVLFNVRVWFSLVVSFLMAYSLFARKIESKEIHYVPYRS